MIHKKIYLVLFALTLFSSTVSAEQIQLVFQGVVNNDPNDPFTVVIEYSSDAEDFTSDQECCGKYGPMAIELTHGNETLSISNANLNVDNIPHELFEGIQWVDDGQPWSGTLLGQTVQTGGIHFGNSGPDYTGEKTKELPLTVDLDDWSYHNGCFELANGDQGCIDLQVQVYDDDRDGVYNDSDTCPDTLENDVVDATGCSIAQLCPAEAFNNHGGLVACTVRASEDFVQSGLITREDMHQIVSSLAKNK